MLGRLIKYEWKNTCRVGIGLILAVVVATLVGAWAGNGAIRRSMQYVTDYATDSYGVDSVDSLLNIVSVISFVTYGLVLVGAVYGLLIYLVVHFYRSMYTDQGYLLHTLPVTKHQILISKLLVSSIWMFVIYTVLIASIFIFCLILVATLAAIEGVGFADVINHIPYMMDQIRYLFRELAGYFTTNADHWLVSMLISVVLGVPTNLLILFGAVSLGQLFSKHRVLMAIVSYIGIQIIGSIIKAIAQASVAGANGRMFAPVETGTDISWVVNLVLAAGCYAACYLITSKRLNMD